MELSVVLAALTFFVCTLVGPFIWVFIKKDIKFNIQRKEIYLRQKEETSTITFDEFSAINRPNKDIPDMRSTNHDVLSLFFIQKQILFAMTATCALIIFTCISAFLYRAVQPGSTMKTLREFIFNNNSVPWSVMIFSASFLIFLVTLTAAYRYKKGVEEKIETLKKTIE